VTSSSAPVPKRSNKRLLVLLTVIAAPFALAFETVVRLVILPADFEDVRAILGPTLTAFAWALPVVCALAGVAGIVLQRRLVDRALHKLSAGRRDDPEAQEKARVGAFLLAASIPQVPAIVATATFTMGASFTPVVVTVIVSTLGVIAQVGRALATRSDDGATRG